MITTLEEAITTTLEASLCGERAELLEYETAHAFAHQSGWPELVGPEHRLQVAERMRYRAIKAARTREEQDTLLSRTDAEWWYDAAVSDLEIFVISDLERLLTVIADEDEWRAMPSLVGSERDITRALEVLGRIRNERRDARVFRSVRPIPADIAAAGALDDGRYSRMSRLDRALVLGGDASWWNRRKDMPLYDLLREALERYDAWYAAWVAAGKPGPLQREEEAR